MDQKNTGKLLGGCTFSMRKIQIFLKKQGLEVNVCVGGGVQEEPYCLTEAEALYELENRRNNLRKGK